MSKPDMTPISRFPDLEKPGRERLNQLLRLFILTTRGDILTRGETYLKRLAVGSAYQQLRVDSGGDDLEWANLDNIIFTAPAELTIDTGAITVTQVLHSIDTESDDVSDDLDTINGNAATNLIFLRAENDGRTVVVKHNTGNIWLIDKVDYSLDDVADGILLVWDGTRWIGLNADVAAQIAVHEAAADPHTGYVKESEFTASEDILVGTGSGTFAKKTPAEVLAILSGDAGAAFSWNDKVLTALAGILATAETELTIDTDGEITVTQMRHKVDTFEDAASDDLSTINGGTTVNLIILRAEADARTVVIKHGTGNIWLQGKADVSLDDLEDGILLVWDSTNSKWFDIAAGGTAGASTALDNLASVAINTSLISDGDNTDDLGSDAVRWKDLFLSGVIECLGGIWDDDQDTGIQVEEGADDDHVRIDTAGNEAVLIHDNGIIDYALQALSRGQGDDLNDQDIVTATWTLVDFPSEAYDVQNEFASDIYTVTEAGKYLVVVNFSTETIDDTKLFQAVLQLNGAPGTGTSLGDQRRYSPYTSASIWIAMIVVADLATSDTLSVYAYHNQGANRHIQRWSKSTNFTIYKMA